MKKLHNNNRAKKLQLKNRDKSERRTTLTIVLIEAVTTTIPVLTIQLLTATTTIRPIPTATMVLVQL